MNEFTDIITAHPLFHGMKPAHLEALLDGATTANLKTGDVLFKEGEPANQFFLIERGQMALEAHEPRDGTALVQTLDTGDLLGWSWLFPPFVWHFRARAVEPTRIIAMSGARLLVNAERDHDFGYELMKRVSQVLIHRLQATRKTMLQLLCESDAGNPSGGSPN